MLEQRTIIAYHLSSSIGDLIKPLGRRMKQVRRVRVRGACPRRYEPLIKAPAWGPDKTLARRMKQVRRVEHHMNWKIKVWSRSCDVREFSFNFKYGRLVLPLFHLVSNGSYKAVSKEINGGTSTTSEPQIRAGS